ncbi:unnamed protein product [Effrenium voratum]|nr:unnamed protein product [Effrenium voratum]
MHSTSSSSRDGPEPSIHAEGKEKQATRRGAVVKGCNGEVDSAMAEAIGEVLAESSPWLQDGKLLEPKGKSHGPWVLCTQCLLGQSCSLLGLPGAAEVRHQERKASLLFILVSASCCSFSCSLSS